MKESEQNNRIDFLADRIRYVRTEIFKLSQQDFSSLVNEYLKEKYGDLANRDRFSQNTMTKLESDSGGTITKLIHLMNFFYERKRINPSWLIIWDNKSMPLFLTKLEVDSTLVELHEKIKEQSKLTNQYINDMRIIIDNSNFDDSSSTGKGKLKG